MSETNVGLTNTITQLRKLQEENTALREALDRIANDETDYPKQVAKEALQEVGGE